MKGCLAVTGALGGLGANVVREAVATGMEVRALVRRDPGSAAPKGVTYVRGDAGNVKDMAALVRGADAVLHCANVNITQDWAATVLRLIDVALEACVGEGVRLVFPANVWVFGRGEPGVRFPESRAVAPISAMGRARAEQEKRIRESKAPFAMVRLPEFYGPHVVTLTGPPLRAATLGKTVQWFGKPDVDVELVFMPDGARAMVAVASNAAAEGHCFHVPGARAITPRAYFAEAIRQTSGRSGFRCVPAWAVRLAGRVYAPARAFADIVHLWEDPVLLDGSSYEKTIGPLPRTPYEEGIARTLEWIAANPGVKMYY